MRKDQLLYENIINNILAEKNILSEGQCEFMLTLSFFFQSPERVYLVTPFMKGGDLYHKLKVDWYLTEDVVRFYTAQIAIALQHLHEFGIAYRDLKPENILIDEDGYIKLCDFGASVHFQGVKKKILLQEVQNMHHQHQKWLPMKDILLWVIGGLLVF